MCFCEGSVVLLAAMWWLQLQHCNVLCDEDLAEIAVSSDFLQSSTHIIKRPRKLSQLMSGASKLVVACVGHGGEALAGEDDIGEGQTWKFSAVQQ